MENFKQLWQIEAEASRQLTSELNVLAEKYNEVIKERDELKNKLETAKNTIIEMEQRYKEQDEKLRQFLGDLEYFQFFNLNKIN